VSKNVKATAVHEFKVPAERVFDAWLDPAKVRSWAARPVAGMRFIDVRRIEIDPRVGGKFTFSDMREEGEAVHWGHYLEIDRPRKLVFTWFTSDEEEQENNSVVTLTIEALANGCRTTMLHSMDERWAEYVEQTAEAWNLQLRQIDMDFAAGANAD
jgi:uncharacterized protein YndB with AHSA1/START domain